ncbi:hypothetical protein [Beggiatoa leptomitoformis]|uniref:Type II secretion system protein n=1 Tax=Beggiatoa leptomitoformis TaxID=288004 RepID=A0A2N9YA94_9GAMM|nr:hypothetical protein [Beggiatoa leptomitoformis]AUI67386.1 hypothetical protein BLE401_00860 [Beggiatoa leptomitoformis]QGX03566.1 hypothetical protein AL038_18600 [Beggiatoa leptomitoformis]
MNKSRHTQTGVVLLLTLLLMIVIGTSFFLAKFNAVDVRIARQAQTVKALAQAKEALLGYALSYYDSKDKPEGLGRFGFLPCPDTNAISGEGTDCGNYSGIQKDSSEIGRFPWRTLGISPLRDGDGECLWYAVSGTYKNAKEGIRTAMLNEDSNGFFEVITPNATTGTIATDRAVAVIIAPHRALTGQQRTPVASTAICGGNYEVTKYIESIVDVANFAKTANKIEKFNEAGNDRIIYITRQELFNLIHKRRDFSKTMECLTQIVTQCIAIYGRNNMSATPDDKRLPFATPIDLSNLYADDAAYLAQNELLKGRLPNTTSIQELIKTCPLEQISLSTVDSCDNTAIKPSNLVLNQDPAKTIFITLWQNWKDHIFYMVAENYKPTATLPIPPCDATNCINSLYAAKITFAGQSLTGQTRTTALLDAIDTKKDVTNYIEGTNDVSFCIKEDLTVEKCSP